MILKFDTPRARAALIYSKLRARRNSARTTPTKPTQVNNSNIPSKIQKVGVMIEAMMINR